MAAPPIREYVIVKTNAERDVYIDGNLAGHANEIISVESGKHTFDLGEPRDYSPESITKIIRKTDEENPYFIKFQLEVEAASTAEDTLDESAFSAVPDFAQQSKTGSSKNPFDLNANMASQKGPMYENIFKEDDVPPGDAERFIDNVFSQTDELDRAHLANSAALALYMAKEKNEPVTNVTWFISLFTLTKIRLEEHTELKVPEFEIVQDTLRNVGSPALEKAAKKYLPEITNTSDFFGLSHVTEVMVEPEVFEAINYSIGFAQDAEKSAGKFKLRHVMATLLFNNQVNSRLEQFLVKQKISLKELMSPCFQAIKDAYPDEDLNVWHKLLKQPFTGKLVDDDDINKTPTSVLAGYTSDSADDKKDLLDIERDVNAICSILAARDVSLPLSLGLFGDWGTGKSFFMNQMYDRIKLLADSSKDKNSEETAFSQHIVQIRFNAWHYIDANLWASLVTHILDSIYTELTKDGEDVWDKAVKNLEHAQGLHEEARQAETQASNAVKIASESLQDVKKEREEKEQEIETNFNSLLTLLKQDGMNELKPIAEKFGLTDAFHSINDLSSQLKELKTRGGRVQGFFTVMLHSQYAIPYLGLLLLLFLLPVAIGVAIPKLTGSEGWATEFGTMMTQLVAGVAAFAAWMKKPLGWLSNGLSELERVQQKAEQAQIDAKKNASPGEAEQELAALQEKEQAAREALRAAEKRLQEAKAELDESQPSRRLYRLIEERTESEDYRSQLGIISLIRNDFSQLSKLMSFKRDRQDKGMAESDALMEPIPLERIVLYIDDLDRCPQDRVVEVLEAVHLLLAFPIFVVVVAVDPRWLRRSLELHYPHLLTSLSENGAAEQRTTRTRAATPQNYLEKIFQIPFNLNPMGEDGYKNLVETLTEPAQMARQVTTPEAPANVTHNVTRNNELATDDGNQVKPAEQAGIQQANRVNTEQTNIPKQPSDKSHDDDQPLIPEEGLMSNAGNKQKGGDEAEIELVPATLEFTENEKKYIATLHNMFYTPRAVKRFINTYRIFKARLEPDLINKHFNKYTELGEYRCVLVLMAIITGFPALAHKVMRVLYLQPDKSGWNKFVDKLVHSEIETADFPSNELPQSLTELKSEWLRMCRTLVGLTPNDDEKNKPNPLPFEMKTFKSWVPYVARFAFSNIEPTLQPDELTNQLLADLMKSSRDNDEKSDIKSKAESEH